MVYKPTIGLEVHAELKTATKMFCNSKNDPNEAKPNVNVCPVCLAHPGTLPVINKAAVKHVLSMGIAVGGTLADFTEFDRKNYFYPDIPKGYQISQFKHPLVSGGSLLDVALTRIHLEEDTARSTHDKGSYSLVDFNRAGVPLMELVTEPVVEDAKQAVQFAKELQLLLRYLDASEANLEKGEMRIEANISVSESSTFGTKVEVKNLNSFRAVERAIGYEIERQIRMLEKGESVIQETRGWDENKQSTFSQRMKEESHDYRYFPDPDLPKLVISEIPEFNKMKLESLLPELPSIRREHLLKYGLKQEDVEMYVSNPQSLGVFFDAVADALDGDNERIQLASNYITSDLVGLYKDTGLPKELISTAKEFATLIRMIHKGEVSSRGGKDVLSFLVKEGGSVRDIASKHSLLQESDTDALTEIVKRIVADNPSAVEEFKGGKESAVQFLIGQCMKATKGAANPKVLKELILTLIG